jgi:hypothetical protein
VYASKTKCNILQNVIAEFLRIDTDKDGVVPLSAAAALQKAFAGAGVFVDMASAVVESTESMVLSRLLTWMVAEEVFDPVPQGAALV